MAKVKRGIQELAIEGGSAELASHSKRVKYTDQHAHLAQIYNNLADDVQATRLHAAGELVRTLSTPDSVQNEKLDAAQTRLIKGLCSGRKAARLGFSIALTEVLRLKLTPSSGARGSHTRLVPLLRDIVKLTEIHGNVPGQEIRDHLLGRRFAYQALLHSDIGLSKHLSDAEWKSFMDCIMTLGGQKPWLRRECGLMLYEYLMTEHSKTLNDARVQIILQAVHDAKLTRTPEGVGLWVLIADRWPDVPLQKGIWTHNNPLSSKERAALTKVMLENATMSDDERIQSGTRQVSPSFAWTVIMAKLFQDQKSKSFRNFWEETVANGMFAAKSSPERRLLGLQVFSLAISTAPQRFLEDVMHPKVLRCILDQRTDSSTYLFDAAKVPLSRSISRASQDANSASALAWGFLTHGSWSFDQATKTKTVETIVATANSTAIRAIVDKIYQRFTSPFDAIPIADLTVTRGLLDLLLMIARQHKHTQKSPSPLLDDPDDSSTWQEVLLKTLVEGAYNVTSASSSEKDLEARRSLFRSRLMSCLNLFIDRGLSTAIYAPVFAVRQIGTIMRDSQNTSSYIKNSVNDARRFMEETLIQSSEPSSNVFALLLAMSILQVYNEEPDGVSALEDLVTCYQSRHDQNSSTTTMLTELLLSFISKPSSLHRKLGEQVFTAFAPEMTADALQSLTDILSKKESISGQQELFDQSDDENLESPSANGRKDEPDTTMDVEDDSDVELVNGLEKRLSDEDTASTAASDESLEDESGVGEEDEEAVFDRKLAEALGTAGADDADSDDDGSEMDDDQMMALEPHLTTIFSERHKNTSKKQDMKEAKENMVNFKSRVLDLLSIYVKSQHANVLALDLILPLASLVRTTSNKATGEKAFAVSKLYFEACNKNKSLPTPDGIDAVFELLAAMHEEMKLGGSKLHANACSRSSLFLSKVLLGIDQEHYKRVAKMYQELQSEWYLDPKSKVQGSIFTEFTSWSIGTRKA